MALASRMEHMSSGIEQSQIRHSTINKLLEKAARRSYGKYLVRVRMQRLRGFEDVAVTFDFPVTALVGPNGGGKTTILGAAATAYEIIKPRQFFAKSGKFDESMSGWRVEYDLIDRDANRNEALKRTASFTRRKWSREGAKRDVEVFGVARTVPANERKELQRCATGSFSVAPDRIDSLKESVVAAVGRILGKDVSRFTHMRVDENGRVSLLAGETSQGTAYSEFHFGAGESSIIRMVMKIESLGDNSLVLIEEIENGLHPVATVRMVEYLIDVAERKGIQAIFTTHSNDALKPLPPQAIWAAVGGHVYQGKLDIQALRAIAGQIDARLAIFCEDEFAAAWLRAMLRGKPGVAPEGVEIHAMLGDGTAVKINKNHNQDPSARFPSVCYIDGDSRQSESVDDRVFRLPGEGPESHVYDGVIEKYSSVGGVLAVRLLQPFQSADKLLSCLREIRLTTMDPHLLFAQVGLRLGLIPESTVRDAFLTTWVEAYPEEVRTALEPIEEFLPILETANSLL